ncbi:MAG: PepSY-associated TM helix domain-containing protein [Myxococcota bacterium]
MKSETRPRPKKNRSKSASARRRWWFQAHAWIGLQLSILLGFVFVTGTFAVFSHEIDWLLEPAMRAPVAVPAEEIAWGAAFDAARRERPEAAWITLDRPVGPAFAVQAVVRTTWQEPVRLWLSPQDGQLLGESGWMNAQRLLRMLHRHLMLPPKVGVPIVSALALPLLVSLVSGLIVYRKFWRGFFRKPRFERRARLVLGDLHRLAGVWGSWFVALIALTGTWYLVESLGGRAPAFPETIPPTERGVPVPASFDGARLDQAIAAARRSIPDLVVQRIQFPDEADGPIVVTGDAAAVLVRVRANRVSVDPVTGDVLGRTRGETLGLHQRIAEAADPLHFGTFGGLPTKLLWFLGGLLMTALALTGVAIYTERVRQGAPARLPEPTDDLEASPAA